MPDTRSTSPAFIGVDIPSDDVLTNCMHCGLCLPHCPTYALTGLEKSSPRGRIRLIKSVAEGELGITPGFVEEMNFCLDCQACETACPAGVQYGSLVEAARAQIYQQGYEGFWSRTLKRWLLNWAFERPARFRVLARMLRMYQHSGLQRLVERTQLLKLFSRRIHETQHLAPVIASKAFSKQTPSVIRPSGQPRYRVGFLAGCIMDVAFTEVHHDTIEVLLRHGCEVIIPENQICCGSLQGHNGGRETARRMARVNIEAFTRHELDYIVVNSAGCSAFMKEYGHFFKNDGDLAHHAKLFSSNVRDLTEFLVETGYHHRPGIGRPLKGKRITYHDACHLVHAQKVSRQPRELIKSVEGITFLELPESTWCCGSAGIYNITRYDDAVQLLDRKVSNIERIQPDIVVTGNPGCMAQIQYGLARRGLSIELLHTATFLRKASDA